MIIRGVTIMAKKIPVEGKTNLYRDSNSGAIINTNKSNAQIAKEHARKVAQDQKRLDNVEYELGEIKSLLKTLIKKKK